MPKSDISRKAMPRKHLHPGWQHHIKTKGCQQRHHSSVPTNNNDYNGEFMKRSTRVLEKRDIGGFAPVASRQQSEWRCLAGESTDQKATKVPFARTARASFSILASQTTEFNCNAGDRSEDRDFPLAPLPTRSANTVQSATSAYAELVGQQYWPIPFLTQPYPFLNGRHCCAPISGFSLFNDATFRATGLRPGAGAIATLLDANSSSLLFRPCFPPPSLREHLGDERHMVSLRPDCTSQAGLNHAELNLQRANTSDTAENKMKRGVVLACPEDRGMLNENLIFLRQHIEFFQATVDDITSHTRGRNKGIALLQVGIRCRYCCHLPPGQRRKGSTYFPSTLMGIYQAAQNINVEHFQSGLCPEMPRDVGQTLLTTRATKTATSGVGKAYWAESARTQGLTDTVDGIRFVAYASEHRMLQPVGSPIL